MDKDNNRLCEKIGDLTIFKKNLISIFIQASEFQFIKTGFLIRPVYTFNAET